jgi:hypothetical protein
MTAMNDHDPQASPYRVGWSGRYFASIMKLASPNPVDHDLNFMIGA